MLQANRTQAHQNSLQHSEGEHKMPKVHRVEKARKAWPGGIEIGDSYYWWKFRFGPKICSKTYPKRSQLTQSSFLSQLWDLEDSINNISSIDDANEILEGLRALGEECQDSFDNMPEQLQESSESGQLLQERIDGLEDWTAEIEDAISDAESDEEEGWLERLIDYIQDTNPGIG